MDRVINRVQQAVAVLKSEEDPPPENPIAFATNTAMSWNEVLRLGEEGKDLFPIQPEAFKELFVSMMSELIAIRAHKLNIEELWDRTNKWLSYLNPKLEKCLGDGRDARILRWVNPATSAGTTESIPGSWTLKERLAAFYKQQSGIPDTFYCAHCRYHHMIGAGTATCDLYHRRDRAIPVRKVLETRNRSNMPLPGGRRGKLWVALLNLTTIGFLVAGDSGLTEALNTLFREWSAVNPN